MSDLIKREDAMKVAMWFGRSEQKYSHSFIKKRVMEIPSADRPQGEWIDTHKVYCGSTVFSCSKCKSEIDEIPTYYNEPMYKWCPYCGADMRGEDDGR